MARMIPAEPSSFDATSERLVFDAFRNLPDSWTILVDVPVGTFGRPRPDMRQIDFLLLHKHLGIMVVEVKGGAIKSERGTWWTLPRGSAEWKMLQRSPFAQAADQRYTLRRYLSERMHIDSRSFSHAVAFPGLDVTGDFGPDAPRQLALGAADLRSPEAALRRARSQWGECPPLSQDTIDSIIAALKPTFEMTILTSSVAAATSDEIERETRRQAQMVQGQIDVYRILLSRERVVILGGAGTGKTVIAAQLARQMATTGSRTLLICHRPGVLVFLYTLLNIHSTQRAYDAGSEELLQVASWARLASAVATGSGRSSIHPDNVDLGKCFFEFRDMLSEPYDVLVLDEGQEFTPNQIEAMKWLLRDPDSSPVYIFADPFQHSGLFSTAARDRLEKRVSFRWALPEDSEVVPLTTNCRNSSPIAEFAGRFYPDAAATPLVDGLAPVFHHVSKAKVLAETFSLVSRLLVDEGFHPNQLLVVVIGSSLKDAERVAARERVATVLVENLFRFPLTPKDLRVAVGRPDDVQGLEGDVTVISYAYEPGVAGTLREMYIAASRPRSLLHVISNLTESGIIDAESTGGKAEV